MSDAGMCYSPCWKCGSKVSVAVYYGGLCPQCAQDKALSNLSMQQRASLICDTDIHAAAAAGKSAACRDRLLQRCLTELRDVAYWVGVTTKGGTHLAELNELIEGIEKELGIDAGKDSQDSP